MKPAIYTEKTECRDCYKCVRECPVKAIRVKNSSAMIDHDRCIFCGRCVHVCPASAKRVRRDLPRAQQLLKLKQRVFVSLAPSFPVYFTASAEQLIDAFQQLGCAGVSETALGADTITSLQNQHIAETSPPGASSASGSSSVLFSSACPPVVELIRKYFPDMTENLVPLHSPMVAHGLLLRKFYGEDIGIVFVGPCIAKKHEADQYPDIIDVALSFEEANQWLKAAGINMPQQAEAVPPSAFSPDPIFAFVPFRAGAAQLFPIEGGMKTAMERSSSAPDAVFVQSGIHAIQNSLEAYSRYTGTTRSFCELLACSGGCIDGCGFSSDLPLAERHQKVVASAESTAQTAEASEQIIWKVPRENYYRSYSRAPADDTNKYSDQEILEALRRLDKSHPEDLKNCGGCGYNTCRDFAAAWLAGMAEKEMCVTEMRKMAQRKANALIRKIPLGIALINNEEKIVECNARFSLCSVIFRMNRVKSKLPAPTAARSPTFLMNPSCCKTYSPAE
ncbi:MAG: [Fe-Fe] hydrogenase large subunit C-terminal domain-containing protein [Spirochaetia bacterium]|nr:[Fe-Fe] hydrogenase large subunit C-terminal domain-containing protein [Spirochaetia bacterium]